MERRDFLRGLGRALRHPLQESERIAEEPPPGRDERVLVLGAGAAGLGAARALAADGARVTVLEARDRAGGRCWTVDAMGVPVDLGATTIHGIDANPIADLADLAGPGLLPSDLAATVLLGDGPPAPLADTEAALDRYDAVLARLLAARDTLPAGASVADGLVALDVAADDQVLRLLRAELGLAHAQEPERIVLAGLLAEVRPPGDDALVDGGLGRLVAGLAEDLDVRTGEEVLAVEHGPAGARVTTRRGTHEADRVICALPAGVLAAGTVDFDPPLPDAVGQALRAIDPGDLTSVAIRLERPLAPVGAEFLVGPAREPGELGVWAVLDEACGAPVVVGWAIGQAARLLACDDAMVAEQALAALARRLGVAAPAIAWSAVARWRDDPFARGAISSLPPGADPAHRGALAGAVSPRLLLAGEAGAGAQAGTVHGALQSGEREAARCFAIMRAVQ